MLVDGVFAAAAAAAPALYAQPREMTDGAQQERFLALLPHVRDALRPLDNDMKRLALEALFARLEVGLREATVGDMGVGKRVRRMAAVVNGYLKKEGVL